MRLCKAHAEFFFILKLDNKIIIVDRLDIE